VPVWFEPQPLAHTLTKTSVMMNASVEAAGAHQNSSVSTAGGRIFACRSHADKRIREFLGTPWSRNSIWSARILRLLRMNASYRFGTYGT